MNVELFLIQSKVIVLQKLEQLLDFPKARSISDIRRNTKRVKVIQCVYENIALGTKVLHRFGTVTTDLIHEPQKQFQTNIF